MNFTLIFTVIFYLAILFIIIKYRKKFVIQAKIIALYRTKIGLKLMDKLAKKYSRFLKFFGYFGIGIGYLGLLFVSFMLVKNFIDLIFVPGMQSMISPVIPGVKIPKSIYVPFWYGIISIFVIAGVHEFSHGIMARLHKIPVKSSGIVFFGPIIGAFVEPDEKIMAKARDSAQLSVLAAGPFSNILLAVIIFFILVYGMAPLLSGFIDNTAVIQSIEAGTPALFAGISPGEKIIEVNNIPVSNRTSFTSVLQSLPANKSIALKTDKNTYRIIPMKKNNVPYIGVQFATVKPDLKKYNHVILALFYLFEFLWWLYVLSFGLGLANLLPLGPVDGGRIVKVTLDRIYRNSKKSMNAFKFVSAVCIVLIIFSLFFPFFRDALL